MKADGQDAEHRAADLLCPIAQTLRVSAMSQLLLHMPTWAHRRSAMPSRTRRPSSSTPLSAIRVGKCQKAVRYLLRPLNTPDNGGCLPGIHTLPALLPKASSV